MNTRHIELRKQIHRVALIILAVAVGVVAESQDAAASERRFTYTYQSLVLSRGDIELEPWTTVRIGRESFYNRFDQRIEIEVGLTDRLQMAWYLNLSALTRDVSGVRESSFNFKSVSSEWKYKLLDPVADPIGFALYVEGAFGPMEAELEAKIILDKQVGKILGAFNIVGEYEWELEGPGKTEREGVIEFDLGLAALLTQAWAIGVEMRMHMEFTPDDGFAHAVLFGGPVVSYAARKWWVALTVLPQLGALKGSDHGPFNLSDHERVETRILFGLHL